MLGSAGDLSGGILAFDMAAERGRAALLDGRHDLQLPQAHMSGIGLADPGIGHETPQLHNFSWRRSGMASSRNARNRGLCR